MHIKLTAMALMLLSGLAFAQEKKVTISAGSKPVFKLSVPKDAEVKIKGEKTTIQAKHLWIYLWRVQDAETVAAVIPNLGEVIKSEFTNFVVSDTKSIEVLGHEAKHLMGKGEEADDGDPGTADVVVFTDGKNVFAACVHGEKDEAAKERPDLLRILKSAELP